MALFSLYISYLNFHKIISYNHITNFVINNGGGYLRYAVNISELRNSVNVGIIRIDKTIYTSTYTIYYI